MNITRFEPWTYLDILHRDLDRMIGGRPGARDDESSVADWVPAGMSISVEVLSTKGTEIVLPSAASATPICTLW